MNRLRPAAPPPGPPAGPTADGDAERRVGTLAGVAAYVLWGVFPLVFHQLRHIAPLEVLLHRITWSFVAVAGLLALRPPPSGERWWAVLRRRGAVRRRLVAASALISVNWLVYVWAVGSGQVVEAALGYYVNPLITVALGVVVLGERLRRAQVVALGFGAASVVVLTVAYGRLPWIALVLACSFAGYGFMKKSVTLPATTSLAAETALLLPVALGGLVAIEVRSGTALAHGSATDAVLLVGLGVVTALPLLLFGTAARRIPLSLLGLLQYLTPTMQLVVGVLVLGEGLPPERLAGFVLVWVALGVLAADALRGARAGRVAVLAGEAAPPGGDGPGPSDGADTGAGGRP